MGCLKATCFNTAKLLVKKWEISENVTFLALPQQIADKLDNSVFQIINDIYTQSNVFLACHLCT